MLFNSHLVSKLLLKKFSKNGKIKVTDIKSGYNELKPPKEVGYIELPLCIFKNSEKKWCNQYEGKISGAYDLLLKRKLLFDKKNSDFLKKLISLLFTRSKPFYELSQLTFSNKLIELKNELLPLGFNERKIEEDWIKSVVGNTPKTINGLLKKVEKNILSYNLEIGESDSDDRFILSDVPVVNIDSKNNKIGILNGVGLTNSDTIYLPIDPNHVVSLTVNPVKDDYIKLTKKQVEKINEYSIKNSIKEYYSFPD